jgi:hypothetical protein
MSDYSVAASGDAGRMPANLAAAYTGACAREDFAISLPRHAA